MDRRMEKKVVENWLMRNQHCYTNNFDQKTTKTNKEIKIQPHNMKLACGLLFNSRRKKLKKDTNLMNWVFAYYCCCRFYAIFILKLKVC